MLPLRSSGELCALVDITLLIPSFDPTGTLVMPRPSASLAPLRVHSPVSWSSEDAW
jgi:hypothetical protein